MLCVTANQGANVRDGVTCVDIPVAPLGPVYPLIADIQAVTAFCRHRPQPDIGAPG
jgi:hypothetical protein